MMKKNIFVIEDDPGIQDILKIILDAAGYDTYIYNNGRELFQKQDRYPDVYIIDKQLSGMNGLDLCRKLKICKETKNIPVIIVSAVPNLDIIAAEAGADDFLEKPFTKANLLNKLEEYCG